MLALVFLAVGVVLVYSGVQVFSNAGGARDRAVASANRRRDLLNGGFTYREMTDGGANLLAVLGVLLGLGFVVGGLSML